MLLDNLVGRLPAVGVAPKVVSDQGKAFEVKPTSNHRLRRTHFHRETLARRCFGPANRGGWRRGKVIDSIRTCAATAVATCES